MGSTQVYFSTAQYILDTHNIYMARDQRKQTTDTQAQTINDAKTYTRSGHTGIVRVHLRAPPQRERKGLNQALRTRSYRGVATGTRF